MPKKISKQPWHSDEVVESVKDFFLQNAPGEIPFLDLYIHPDCVQVLVVQATDFRKAQILLEKWRQQMATLIRENPQVRGEIIPPGKHSMDDLRKVVTGLQGWAEKTISIPVESWKRIKAAGYRFRSIINCPFHDEKTPSCTLDAWSHDEEPHLNQGTWHCFGCGVGGELRINAHEVGSLGINVPTSAVLGPQRH